MNAFHLAAPILTAVALIAVAAPAHAAEPLPGEVRAEQVAVEREGNIVLGLAGHLGVHDTITLSREDDDGEREQTDLYAAPTAGFALEADYKLSDVFAVGLESLFLWVEHEDDGDRRMIISPHARVRLAFPLSTQWSAEGLVGLGMTWWEEDEPTDNQALDAIADSRLGVGLRMAVGLSWAMSDLVATTAQLGYTTALTPGEGDEGFDARFGTVLLGLGLRLGL